MSVAVDALGVPKVIDEWQPREEQVISNTAKQRAQEQLQVPCLQAQGRRTQNNSGTCSATLSISAHTCQLTSPRYDA